MSSIITLRVSSPALDPTPFLARSLLPSGPSDLLLGVLTSLTILAVTDLALNLVNVLHPTRSFSADRYSTRRLAQGLLSLSALGILKILKRLLHVTSADIPNPVKGVSRTRMGARLTIALLIFTAALGADVAAIVLTAQSAHTLEARNGTALVLSLDNTSGEVARVDDGELAKTRTYPLVLEGFDDFVQSQALVVTSDLVYNQGGDEEGDGLGDDAAVVIVGYGDEGKPSDRERSVVVSILKTGFGYTSKTRVDLALPGDKYDSASLIFDAGEGRGGRNADVFRDLLSDYGCEEQDIFSVGPEGESVGNSGVSRGHACRREVSADANNLDNEVASMRNYLLSSLRVDLIKGKNACIVRELSDVSLFEKALPVSVRTVLRRALGEVGLLIFLAAIVSFRLILGMAVQDDEDFVVLSALKEVSGVGCNLGYLNMPNFFLSNSLSCDKNQNYHYGLSVPYGFDLV